MNLEVSSPRGTAAAASADEVTAIVAALREIDAANDPQPTARPSRWRLASRIYEIDAP